MAPFFEVKHDSVKNGKPKIYNKPRNDDKPWFTDECKRLYRAIFLKCSYNSFPDTFGVILRFLANFP
jgi:hypothetical protein